MKKDFRYPTISIYPENGSWFWRAVGVTDRVLATSGAYETKYYAREAAERFVEIAQYSTIVDKESVHCSWCGMRTIVGTERSSRLHERCQEAKVRARPNQH